MTDSNNSLKDNQHPPAEGEADQPMVAVQPIMVAEQTQKLATATNFATPDATTLR